MANPERARRRRRDIGLAKVGRWTRYSIASGVVLSGVLGAGVAHVLPGQAAAAQPKPAPKPAPAEHQAANQPEDQAPNQAQPSAAPSAAGTTHDRKKAKRLSPPSAAPRPAPTQSQHATSGGS
jgi:hypothetical protein